MNGTRATFRCRVGLFVLVGLSSLAASASTAQAAGCHVPDRPVLGDTFTWDRLTEAFQAPQVVHDRPSALLRTLPCPFDAPLATSLHVLPESVTTARVVWWVRAMVSERVDVRPFCPYDSPFASRLDRPPRAA